MASPKRLGAKEIFATGNPRQVGAKQLLTRISYAWLLQRIRHKAVKSTIKDKIALSVVEKDLTKPLVDQRSLSLTLAHVGTDELQKLVALLREGAISAGSPEVDRGRETDDKDEGGEDREADSELRAINRLIKDPIVDGTGQAGEDDIFKSASGGAIYAE